MSYPNFTDISAAMLASTDEGFAKESSSDQFEEYYYRVREKISHDIDNLLDMIVDAKSGALLKHSSVSEDEYVEHLTKLSEDIEEIKDAVTNKAIQEAESEEVLEDAAKDPKVASKILKNETGEKISPEVIDQISQEVAENLAEQESGKGTSEKKSSGLLKISNQLSPLAIDIINRRALMKLSYAANMG